MDIPSIRQNAIKRIWVFSDLQQSVPENARRCMLAGVSDFLSLEIPVDAVCYLGDTTEGTSLPHLREMAEMQVEALSRVDAPVYYAMGNHEFDYHRAMDLPGRVTIPMRDRVLRESQWHTSPRVSDPFFSVDLGGLTLAFLTDCAAEDGSWWTTHCWPNPRGEIDAHPSRWVESQARVRGLLSGIDTPFFLFSHYGFPGGNRDDEGPLQRMLLPLPGNAIAHFYGHSHCGDHVWGKRNFLRQISTIDESGVTQFDIASFEDIRGSAVRSAIIEWYGGQSYGVFFRDHSARAWTKTYLQSSNPIGRMR